jgi:hypothetical protein
MWEIEEIHVLIIAVFIAAIGVFFSAFETRRSINISRSNAEIAILREFHKSTSDFRNATTVDQKILCMKRILNTLEHLVKDVKRRVYSFDDYLKGFYPTTVRYFTELDKLYIMKRKTTDDAKKYLKDYHPPLFSIYKIYEEARNDALNGIAPTGANLEVFLNDYTVENSTKKKLKKKFKKRWF